MLPPVISSIWQRRTKPNDKGELLATSNHGGKQISSEEESRRLLHNPEENSNLKNNGSHYRWEHQDVTVKNFTYYCICHSARGNSSKSSSKMKEARDFISQYANIRWLGILLFILASVFCISKIVELSDDDGSSPTKVVYRTQLKLVNVFNRHGDRAPSDRPPESDPMGDKIKLYWPNGMSNLTDMGKLRQFKIGLELRRRYEKFLDFDPNSYLAFSSPIVRCVDSLEQTLRGLFNNEGTLAAGHRVIAEYEKLNCTKSDMSLLQLIAKSTDNSTCRLDSLPNGSGSPLDWRKITIDTQTVPVLTYQYLNGCKYRLQNPSPLDKNLFESQLIRDINGTKELAELINKQYNITFGFDTLSLWSTVASELRLIKTKESFEFIQPQIGWVNKRLPQYYGSSSPINLFDIHEQVVVIGYRDRLELKETPRIQLGPMIGTMVQSQLNALGKVREGDNQTASTLFHKNNQMFKDKKMIIYSSHDSILQFMMFRLSLIHPDEKKAFKTRFEQAQSSSDVQKYLAGLKMSNFGMSLVFSLWEIEMQRPRPKRLSENRTSSSSEDMVTVKRFPYVQALLYNREDGKHQAVSYDTLELGLACQRLFKKLYPKSSVDQFYDSEFKSRFKHKTMCPFELFLNVTSEYLFTRDKLNEWCD